VASPEEGNPPQNLGVAGYLWEEYRYRHDLVWRLMFRVTSVVTILLLVPFIADDGARRIAGNWILVPPILAIAVALMGIIELDLEMKLFKRVQDTYRECQDAILQNTKTWKPYSQNTVKDRLIDTRFARLVRLYLLLILLAATLALVFVVLQLPEIRSDSVTMPL
jgi:hypothetical protein